MESGQELDSDQYGRQEVVNRQEVKMYSIREVYSMQEMYGGLEVEVYGGQEVEMDGIREVNDGPREGRAWGRGGESHINNSMVSKPSQCGGLGRDGPGGLGRGEAYFGMDGMMSSGQT